jgi:uncharacterized protein (TIGR03086 family)
MNVRDGTAALTRDVALLERAMGYTLGSLLLVTPDAMSNPTPCSAWDLRALLLHMNESLLTLHEAITMGRLDLVATASPNADYGDPERDPVASLRNRACQMIGSWAAGAVEPRQIAIADRELAAGLVAATGAVEVAVHGWDVARACRQDRPVPPALAEELLVLGSMLVDDGDRPTRFADPVPLPTPASPSDRLVALLGRRP